MNKKLVVLTAVLGLTTFGWADTKKEDAIDRVENATKVVHEMMAAPDKGIPQEVLDHAKCIAVVPHMIKGRIHRRREWRQGRGYLPYSRRMERAGLLHRRGRKLGLADRR